MPVDMSDSRAWTIQLSAGEDMNGVRMRTIRLAMGEDMSEPFISSFLCTYIYLR